MAFTNPKENIAHLNLGEDNIVADLGSGSGAYSLAAAEIVKTGKVYAIDVQKGLLDRVSKEASDKGFGNIEIIWADLEKISGSNIKDNSVDAVIISNILFLVEDKESFAKEASRILKPNGKALVIDWSDSFGGLGPQPGNVFKEEEAVTLLKGHGFEIDKKIADAGEHHYGFIAKLKK